MTPETLRIALIQGHPDPAGKHYCHALATAYAEAAAAAGHLVRCIDVAAMDFPILRSKADWEQGATPAAVQNAQKIVSWAQHLVIIHPLWLGSMPALLKGFFEQIARPGYAVPRPGEGGLSDKMLAGRSARIVVTMGMPALLYRLYFRSHGVKTLERNILRFVGVRPVRTSIVGLVEGKPEHRQHWLEEMRRLGARGR